MPKDKKAGRLGSRTVVYQAWTDGPTGACPTGFSLQQGGKYSNVCRYRCPVLGGFGD